MNRTISLATIMAMAVMTAASCDQSAGQDETMPGQPAELTISIRSGLPSKAASSSVDETAISGTQILIFRENGNLDAYASSTSATDIKISCTSGTRTIYAAANAPDLSDILSLDDFKSRRTALEDNSTDSFVMVSEANTVNAPQSSGVVIEVHRLVARVSISKVSVKFASSAYQNEELKVTRLYLVNAAGDAAYGGTSSPQVWFNKMKYSASDADGLIYEDIADDAVTEASPYTATSYFYTYPNDTETDVSGESSGFSARYTRLVIETTLSGTTYYYPVSIPGIESNHTYEIKNLTITRPGSLDPDIPVSYDTCSFSITVRDWDSGSSEEVTI